MNRLNRLKRLTRDRVAELTVYDKSKMDLWIALRNSLGVAIALLIGLITHQPVTGLIIGLGAINVAFADSREAYAQRLKRMLASTALCCLAALLGSFTVFNMTLSMVIAALWAFAAGLFVVFGTNISDLFVISLTLYIISATQAVPFEKALSLAFLTAIGGFVQILLSTCLWAFRRFHAERRALNGLFRTLAGYAVREHDASSAPFASETINQVHEALASALRSNDRDSDRYKFLLAQGERIRVSLLAVTALAKRGGDLNVAPETHQEIHVYLQTANSVLESIADCLLHPRNGRVSRDAFQHLSTITQKIGDGGTRADWRKRLEALNGQLRAAADIAENLDVDNWTAPTAYEKQRPLRLRPGSALATLRANLNFRSTAFRHATRLAFGALVGEWLSHSLQLKRSYWIPMTIVIVLKPDYNATISRGLLRIVGTFTGIVFSGILFHYVALGFIPMPVEAEIVIAGVLMFLLRWIGTTNYGIFAFLIATLVVFLFAIEGVPPQDVMLARTMNTAIGGAVAIFLYLLWPTFERVYIIDSFVELLRDYNLYLAGVCATFTHPEGAAARQAELDAVRVRSRTHRSNHEALIQRYSLEPRTTAVNVSLVRNMQASSNRFVNAAMSLDAAAGQGLDPRKLKEFSVFAETAREFIDKIIALLQSPGTDVRFPDLRGSYLHILDRVGFPGNPVEIDLDRLTNALTTLREQAQKAGHLKRRPPAQWTSAPQRS